MSLTRIYKIAKKYNLPSGKVVEICTSLGMEVKNYMSSVNPEQEKEILKIINKMESQKEPKPKSGRKVKEKSGIKVKIESRVKSELKAVRGKVEKIKKIAKKGIKEEAKIKSTRKPEKEIKAVPKDKDVSKPGAKVKKKNDWEEGKEINIRRVLGMELDKEEKEGGRRIRVTLRKKALPGKKDKGKEETKNGTKGEKPSKITVERPSIKKVIELPETVTVKQLSEKINVSSSELIKTLFGVGEFVNINQNLNKDLIKILSQEYNFKYNIVGFKDELNEIFRDSEEDLVERAPIVTVMGHVDHGKTTLLDVIRETNVAVGEAGGITQQIGAYQVEYNKRKITFVDTPGHEAFTSMRARGAKVTDIAVIVIAADDGIMPQTVEAINHAKEAGVPIIIAINKIDLPNSNPGKIKKELTKYELVTEEWGGDTICIELSAKNKTNIKELLEMILLVADINEIKGNPNADGSGIIIESKLDKGIGPVGTIIVKRGAIKVGDFFVTGNSCGKVRLLKDEKGKSIKKADLSKPVKVSGFSIVPKAGDKFFVVKNEKVAKELINKINYDKRIVETQGRRRPITLEELSEISKEEKIKKLRLVLKADANGSLDAVEQALSGIEEENVKIDIIHKAVGAISNNDIMLASASGAIVIGFGVVQTVGAKILAKEEKIDVKAYSIIYKLIDDIKLAFKGLLEPEIQKVEKGKIEVREIFTMPKVGVIAGCYVAEGAAERNDRARLVRDEKIIYEGKILSLHRYKKDVKKVAAGYECGVRIENYQDINKGDIIEVYEEKEIL